VQGLTHNHGHVALAPCSAGSPVGPPHKPLQSFELHGGANMC
jgi:hypothetical protein